jgi:23S rRNA (adenine2030-N6)-methyltransferase
MLSYQHEYHAGNFADVHKHLVLWLVLDALLARPKPFVALDLFAGSGLYSLDRGPAARSGEWRDGIGRLWALNRCPSPLRAWLDAIRSLQPDPGRLTTYPGSSALIRQRLREQDRLVACELHPGAHAALQDALGADPRCHLHRRDAREAARALFPPEPRRGLVLLDPAYERVQEYAEIPEMTREIRRRWNTGTIVVWYPLLEDGRHPQLRSALLSRHPGEEILFSEMRLSEPLRGPRLQGSGMAVLNMPWQLDRRVREVMSPVWRELDPQGRGGLFQATALENVRDRPQFERIEPADSTATRDLKDHD